ncbi:hypothetical protein [Paracoccus sp. Ld10]|uniref:hypothetical protein n=1 Tax=Paracoccus sp. Ld10 TaxID=649158 RepID=UPI0038632C86
MMAQAKTFMWQVKSPQMGTRMCKVTRLSRLLDVLLHIARADAPMTFQQIVVMLALNAVMARQSAAMAADG